MCFPTRKSFQCIFANRTTPNSKFFGKPNGSTAPAKQSKLSFSSKSTSNGVPSSSAAKENEDVDMEDTAEKKVPTKVEEDALAKKENVKPGTGRYRLVQLDSIC